VVNQLQQTQRRGNINWQFKGSRLPSCLERQGSKMKIRDTKMEEIERFQSTK